MGFTLNEQSTEQRKMDILFYHFLLWLSLSKESILFNIFYAVDFNYIKESEEMRLAMQPLELIKRVSVP